MEFNRNLIITLILSCLILFSWDYFFLSNNKAPEVEAPQVTQVTATTPTIETIEENKAEEQNAIRVAINTPKLEGSINLQGAAFDDIKLKKYKENLKEDSPEIALLAPKAKNNAYFAELGYSADSSMGDMPNNKTEWTLVKGEVLTEKTPITLQYVNSKGVVFEREISVDASYLFTVTDRIVNKAGKEINFRSYGRIARADLTNIGKDTTVVQNEGLMGVFEDNSLYEISYKKLRSAKPHSFESVAGGWLAVSDKYWATTLIPTNSISYKANISYINGGKPHYQADYISNPINLANSEELTLTTHIFAGAKEVEVVNGYAKQLNLKNFDLLIDWGWFKFFTKPMFYIIDWFYKLTGNFGIAIILTTILLKVILFPLSNKSYKSMARMRELQPQIKLIQEKYPDDMAQRNKETMTLYKQEKVNPLAGCWPMLVQFPIFFSIYKVLYITIEMRHAPFFGWIKDLSAPDPTSIFNLFGLLPFEVPSMLLIGIWPIIMGVTMAIQMSMSPTTLPDQQAIIMKWMPVALTFVMAGFPAGLVIYWATNNTLTILQQFIAFRNINSNKNKAEKV